MDRGDCFFRSGMSRSLKVLFLAAITFCCLFTASESPAASSRDTRINSQFQIPPILRGRVNFWINIFAKYGEHHKIVHHRLYPQVVFGVLDFTKDAEELDPVALRRRMVAEEEAAVTRVKEALLFLGTGSSPETPLQTHIVKSMAIIRGGPAKYREVVENDWVRTQTGIRDKFVEAMKRSGRYLHFIEDIFVNENGLPRELTRIPFIESTFNYEAVSSAGAAGLWQFMRETGKGFGMRINAVVDERKDPIIASRSAAQYMRRAYNRLGSWPLAVTSYNHGITGVLRKMKEAGTNDLARVIESGPANPFGFASTNFWPEFLAAVEVQAHFDRYFPGLQLYEPLRLSERRLPLAMSIGAISRETGVDIETLKVANYALGKQVWEGRSFVPAGYTLRVPHNFAVQLAQADFTPVPREDKARNYASVPVKSRAGTKSARTYVVAKNDTLASIAKKKGISIETLKKQNKLKGDTLKPGQVLALS